jgi:hypothetical protein
MLAPTDNVSCGVDARKRQVLQDIEVLDEFTNTGVCERDSASIFVK